ncbi:MAG: serine/threonine protein kinase [Acidobacteria bacterium]|nr:serine/threonine protein kinase [Acidobacteriota bacterium]
MHQTHNPLHLAALLEAARLLHGSLDPDELLQRLFQLVLDHLSVARALVALQDTEGTMRLAQVQGFPYLKPGDEFDHQKLSHTTLSFYPIGGGLQPIGVLGLAERTYSPILADEQAFLTHLIEIAGNALTNARTYQRVRATQQGIQERRQNLQTILNLQRELQSLGDPEVIAHFLVTTLAERWAVAKFAFALWKTGHPEIRDERSVTFPASNLFTQFPGDLQSAILVADLPESDLKATLSAQKVQLLFTISIDDTLVGAIIFGPRLKHILFQPNDLEFGTELIAQAAIALANAWTTRDTIRQRQLEAFFSTQQNSQPGFEILGNSLSGLVINGQYELEQPLAAGSSSIVYRATHISLNRPVAVKLLRPPLPATAPNFPDQTPLEALAARNLSHPNAVTMIDQGISETGFAYLVMELLEGRTLAEELRQPGSIPVKRALTLALPLCHVLAEAHRRGILHRDLKPDNIFLVTSGTQETIKVIDFGHAKLLDPQRVEPPPAALFSGLMIGNPTYLAPERLQNQSYDTPSDIYSLGVILYEMLCGQPPFTASDGNPLTIALAHLTTPPPSPQELNPALSPQIERLLLQALDKSPARRPTAENFAQALLHALADLEPKPKPNVVKLPPPPPEEKKPFSFSLKPLLRRFKY